MKTYFKQLDREASAHSKRVQEVFSKVAEVQEKVYTPLRGIFGKRLNKIYKIHCVVCFMN